MIACGKSPHATAVTVASDSASDPAYAFQEDGSWRGVGSGEGENPGGMDNGGSGFNPWDFAGGFHNPDRSAYGNLNHFIDGVDFPASSFNDLGAPAFALANADLAGVGVTTNATRPFFQPLQVGDTFHVDFDTPAVYEALSNDDFPFAIIGFHDASDNTTFLIEGGSSLGFGDFNWRYDDANNDNFDTGIAPTATSDGSSLNFTLTSMSTAELLFDGQLFNIDLIAGVPAAVRFTLFANSSGDGMGNPTGEREFFFNNLMISDNVQQVMAGDFNNDGVVDRVDYLRWQRGESPNPLSASDLADWEADFGASLSSSLAHSNLNVPEPSVGLLLLVGCAMVLLQTQRVAP